MAKSASNWLAESSVDLVITDLVMPEKKASNDPRTPSPKQLRQDYCHPGGGPHESQSQPAMAEQFGPLSPWPTFSRQEILDAVAEALGSALRGCIRTCG